jgi:hypothetical protein
MGAQIAPQFFSSAYVSLSTETNKTGKIIGTRSYLKVLTFHHGRNAGVESVVGSENSSAKFFLI